LILSFGDTSSPKASTNTDKSALYSPNTQYYWYRRVGHQHRLKMANIAQGAKNLLPNDIHNRPDEFKIEQGLHADQLPFLDQTGDVTVEIQPRLRPEFGKDEEAIKAVGNRDDLFKREREGWNGWVLPFLLTALAG
jgi:hypothetical protein